MPTIDTTDPALDFAQVELTFGKVSKLFAKSISYGDSMEFSDVEGNSRIARGRTAGMYKTDEGTVEVYLEDYALLLEEFGDAFYDMTFEATVAYSHATAEGGAGRLKADELIGCRFTKRSSNYQTGSDALTKSLGFKPLYIREGGRNPLKVMPTGTQGASAAPAATKK